MTVCFFFDGLARAVNLLILNYFSCRQALICEPLKAYLDLHFICHCTKQSSDKHPVRFCTSTSAISCKANFQGLHNYIQLILFHSTFIFKSYVHDVKDVFSFLFMKELDLNQFIQTWIYGTVVRHIWLDNAFVQQYFAH